MSTPIAATCPICSQDVSVWLNQVNYLPPDGPPRVRRRLWIDLIHNHGSELPGPRVTGDDVAVLLGMGDTEGDATPLRTHAAVVMYRLLDAAHPGLRPT